MYNALYLRDEQKRYNTRADPRQTREGRAATGQPLAEYARPGVGSRARTMLRGLVPTLSTKSTPQESVRRMYCARVKKKLFIYVIPPCRVAYSINTNAIKMRARIIQVCTLECMTERTRTLFKAVVSRTKHACQNMLKKKRRNIFAPTHGPWSKQGCMWKSTSNLV